jgi:hypothetical protein
MENASVIDLKYRYHQLASKYHPDKNIEANDQQKKSELFHEIQAAYEELNKFYTTHKHLPFEITESIYRDIPLKHESHQKKDQPNLSSIVLFSLLAVLLITILFFIPAQDNPYFQDQQKLDDSLDTTMSDTSTSLSEQAENKTSYPTKYKRKIRIGMTMGKVFDLLGVPDSTVGDNWYYDNSEIYFRDGLVAGWNIDPASSIKTAKGQPLHRTPLPH